MSGHMWANMTRTLWTGKRIPALMVSTAEKGSMVLNSFEFSDVQIVFPNESTAVMTRHVKQGVSQRGDNTSTLQEMHRDYVGARARLRLRMIARAIHPMTPMRTAQGSR